MSFMHDSESRALPSSPRTCGHSALHNNTILILVHHEGAWRGIEAALAGVASVVRCRTVRDARAILATRTVSAIVTEPTDSAGSPTSVMIHDAKRRFPRTALLGCVSRSSMLSGEALALIRAGVQDLLLEEDLDLARLVRQVVAAARLRCLVDVLWPQLEPTLDDVLAPFLRFGLEHAFAQLDLRTVASALGAHRKTLWQRCRTRGVPPPRELLSWCRVLAAVFALDDDGRTVDSVAHELDFPSPSALRNLLQRYLRLTPTGVRARGGSAYAVRCLAERLRTSMPLRRAIGQR